MENETKQAIARPRGRLRSIVVVILTGLVAATAALFAVSPAAIGFVIAVMVAIGWCWWLDEHQSGRTGS